MLTTVSDMRTSIFSKTIMALLFAILVSSAGISVDAKVKKHKKNSKQTSTAMPSGYSKALVNKAKAGDTYAQVQLGMCYEQGDGVQADEKSALYWYDKAAAKGHPYGQALAAMMYLQGRGTEVNEAKAFQLAQSSANKSNAYGEYVLGACYLYGLGVEQNVKKAWDWLMKASNQGVEYAKNTLNEILADEDLAFEATYNYKDWNSDSKAWAKAKSLNTTNAYLKYLELYPEGLHTADANDAYVEASIDKALKGEYYNLPQYEKINNTYGTESTSEIQNKTDYRIEVLFSGPEKKRVVINKNETKNTVLKNGSYKVVAKALNGNVGKYYGTMKFDGGVYSGYFYITSSPR